MDAPLPRLPLPPLPVTCARFLERARPLLDATEYRAAAEAVTQLLAGPGARLQRALEQLDAGEPTSYVYRFWTERYLEDRRPLVLHQNVAGVLDPHPGGTPLPRWIAAVIGSMVEFHCRVRDGALTPDRFGAQPLCMHQYPFLFGTARIPGATIDTLSRVSESRHVVVAWRGAFHVIDVAQDDGCRPVAAIQRRVEAIVGGQTTHEPHVGLLTTLGRSEWARARQALLECDPRNRRNLELIDSALALVCIDDEAVDDSLEALSRNALYGNGHNRWFDKSIQLIVTADGTLAGNMEHSALDGLPMVRLGLETWQRAAALVAEPESACDSVAPVESLHWQLTPAIERLIEEAADRFSVLAREHDTRVLTIDTLGSSAFARHGINADAAVQLALQLTHARVHGRTVAAYEPAPMRHFAYGRTEGMQPATPQALAFLDVMTAHRAGAYDALVTAARTHVEQREACARGEGVDRHLFALCAAARQQADPVPDFFRTAAYAKVVNGAALSTSSVPVVAGLRVFAFGPPALEEPSYGIAYLARPRRLTFNITSRTGHADAFGRELAASMADIGRLVADRAGAEGRVS